MNTGADKFIRPSSPKLGFVFAVWSLNYHGIGKSPLNDMWKIFFCPLLPTIVFTNHWKNQYFILARPQESWDLKTGVVEIPMLYRVKPLHRIVQWFLGDDQQWGVKELKDPVQTLNLQPFHVAENTIFAGARWAPKTRYKWDEMAPPISRIQ